MKKAPIDDSVILITGASSGIGQEFARQLAFKAKALILVARRRDRLEALKDELLKRHTGLAVSVLTCDLTDLKAIDGMLAQAVREHGFIDILINNAGFGDIGFFERSSWPKLEAMIQTNIVALTYLTRKLVEPMVERKRGGILMVSSSAGLQSLPLFGVYSGTKHYVTAFSEALRAELSPVGIVVTLLCPGPVATEFEQVAAPDSKPRVPKFVELSAERCARIAINGFTKGRAMIIPGAGIRILMLLQGMTPRWVMRVIMGGVARIARKEFQKVSSR
jgi:uncharacterized protein